MTTEPTTAVVELGRGWPGWVPRVILLLAGLAAAIVLAGGDVNSIALGFLIAFAIVLPLVPATPAPTPTPAAPTPSPTPRPRS